MTDKHTEVELFQAFAVEELESRLQNGFGYGQFGDEYYGCSLFLKS